MSFSPSCRSSTRPAVSSTYRSGVTSPATTTSPSPHRPRSPAPRAGDGVAREQHAGDVGSRSAAARRRPCAARCRGRSARYAIAAASLRRRRAPRGSLDEHGLASRHAEDGSCAPAKLAAARVLADGAGAHRRGRPARRRPRRRRRASGRPRRSTSTTAGRAIAPPGTRQPGTDRAPSWTAFAPNRSDRRPRRAGQSRRSPEQPHLAGRAVDPHPRAVRDLRGGVAGADDPRDAVLAAPRSRRGRAGRRGR